ncbi:DUF1003 domain-containing protein [Fibrella sp. HMF5335]|uniref:DUF1003 domain-containing protein n=1 Tax=Fibrella rubiginis TaxID=2817060 RepID=A0A939GHS9_9BACT|nr:DUF1003 domain-containing protein [Fibrella rubiginis]MBO0939304.1 DUF1003 domain-containing protein [Fibrella rubiginis]
MKNRFIVCGVSGNQIPIKYAVPVSTIDKRFRTYVHGRYPNLSADGYIGQEQLIALQSGYVQWLLSDEAGKLNELEREILDTVNNNEILNTDIEDVIEHELTLGEHIADRVAAFGGSWIFIGIFFTFLVVWMATNAFTFRERGFDPYPFILLNLILSCLAAIQAPIIMMSQNRQADKDRQRSEHEYKINLKAELEITLLHKKIDHVLIYQNRRLLELQQIQTQMIELLTKRQSSTES